MNAPVSEIGLTRNQKTIKSQLSDLIKDRFVQLVLCIVHNKMFQSMDNFLEAKVLVYKRKPNSLLSP